MEYRNKYRYNEGIDPDYWFLPFKMTHELFDKLCSIPTSIDYNRFNSGYTVKNIKSRLSRCKKFTYISQYEFLRIKEKLGDEYYHDLYKIFLNVDFNLLKSDNLLYMVKSNKINDMKYSYICLFYPKYTYNNRISTNKNYIYKYYFDKEYGGAIIPGNHISSLSNKMEISELRLATPKEIEIFNNFDWSIEIKKEIEKREYIQAYEIELDEWWKRNGKEFKKFQNYIQDSIKNT